MAAQYCVVTTQYLVSVIQYWVGANRMLSCDDDAVLCWHAHIQRRRVVRSTQFFLGYPGDLGNFHRSLDFCVCRHGPGYPGDLAWEGGASVSYPAYVFWEPISCTLLVGSPYLISLLLLVGSPYRAHCFCFLRFLGSTGPGRYLIWFVVESYVECT